MYWTFCRKLRHMCRAAFLRYRQRQYLQTFVYCNHFTVMSVKIVAQAGMTWCLQFLMVLVVLAGGVFA